MQGSCKKRLGDRAGLKGKNIVFINKKEQVLHNGIHIGAFCCSSVLVGVGTFMRAIDRFWCEQHVLLSL